MELHLYDPDEAPTIVSGESVVDEVVSGNVTEERGAETPVEDRRGYLGGSDAAVIAGLSPWKTAYQLWLEKTGREQSPDLSGNERVYWGQILEEIVAREYQQRTGNKVRRANKLFKHPYYPFLGAHIDRDIVKSAGILEVKTTGRRDNWGEPGTDEIPDYYMAQVQHYMGIVGATWADIAVLFSGQEMAVYSVLHDDEFIEALFKLERRFWEENVLGDTPPTPSSSEEASQMWASTRPGVVNGNALALSTAERLYEVKQQIKEYESEKDRLELELKKQMEDIGDTLMVDGKKIATWKTQTARRFNTKLFEKDYPDLYDEYKRENESRVFRLSYKPKQEK